MPQVINTNIMSLMTRNNMNKSQGSLNTAIERLSSGLRINSAKDDAAGQAIANRFTANIKGLTQASRNANDGISISQTAEGALSEINNNVQRIRELTVKAANGTNSQKDVDAINKEISQRVDEVQRIVEQTDFNGVKLLSTKDGKGQPTPIIIQVGANDGEVIKIDLKNMSTKDDGALKALDQFQAVPSDGNKPTPPADDGKGGKSVQASDPANQLQTLDGVLAVIDEARSQFGAAQSRFESASSSIDNTANNMSAALSRIQDADYAEEVSNMTRAQILQQAGTSVLAQANQVPQLVLSLLR